MPKDAQFAFANRRFTKPDSLSCFFNHAPIPYNMRAIVLVGVTLLALGGGSVMATAQTRTGGMHTAPGKPLHLQASKPSSLPQAKTAPRPKKEALNITLPRYWSTADSAQRELSRAELYRIFWRNSFPPATVWHSAGDLGFQMATLRLHVVINPDGTIRSSMPTAQQVDVDVASNSTSATDLFVAEAKRALQRVRFTPSSLETDTVTLTLKYRLVD